MQFGLNEILSLHYLNNANYDAITMADPALNEKGVDGRTCRIKFLGSYYIILDQYSDFNYNSNYNRIKACSEFMDADENNNPYPIQKLVVKEALEKQLNFLSEIPTFPDGKGDMLPYLTDKEAVAVLQWLENLEMKHGAVHDIKPAYEILLEDNPNVQKLKQIKENFDVFMIERGFPLDVPVFS